MAFKNAEITAFSPQLKIATLKSNFGITKVPFFQAETKLLNQQWEIFNIINIHSQQGGLCVITGDPGVGKSVIKAMNLKFSCF